jgi:hypothetical protein
MMLRKGFRHGFAESDWEKAKAEARHEMIERAQKGKTITYSELVEAIDTIKMEPHDPRLAHFLGEIAEEENEAGRGLLTVVVVHKFGDQMPGPGFFEMSKKLGRNTHDPVKFWISELNLVRAQWASLTL